MHSKMQKSPAAHHSPPMRTGALTLLFVAVLVCLALLAVLSLATARADCRKAEKQLESLQQAADAEQAGQQWLAEVDAALKNKGVLPQTAQQSGNTITAALELDGEGTLYIALETEGEAYTITRWQLERSWQASEELQLWDGG